MRRRIGPPAPRLEGTGKKSELLCDKSLSLTGPTASPWPRGNGWTRQAVRSDYAINVIELSGAIAQQHARKFTSGFVCVKAREKGFHSHKSACLSSELQHFAEHLNFALGNLDPFDRHGSPSTISQRMFGVLRQTASHESL